MNVVYGVPWIEVEYGWGDRPEGWRLFADLKECVRETKRASESGPYDGGYCGPERPLMYYEIPYDALSDEAKAEIHGSGKYHTKNYWSPKFKDVGHRIE